MCVSCVPVRPSPLRVSDRVSVSVGVFLYWPFCIWLSISVCMYFNVVVLLAGWLWIYFDLSLHSFRPLCVSVRPVSCSAALCVSDSLAVSPFLLRPPQSLGLSLSASATKLRLRAAAAACAACAAAGDSRRQTRTQNHFAAPS